MGGCRLDAEWKAQTIVLAGRGCERELRVILNGGPNGRSEAADFQQKELARRNLSGVGRGGHEFVALDFRGYAYAAV